MEPGDILIAAMKGIACEARRNVEAAEAFSGSIVQLQMVGGAARSELWTQIVADILQRPVYLSRQKESAAFGAARLAAGDLSADWKTADEEKVFLPSPEVSGWANDNYTLYLQTYKALLPVLENAQRTKGSSY
jgi:sugar (pentulose or hexulose) kinase